MKQKNNSLMQSPHNQGKAWDLPAALIQWFYEETLPGEGRQKHRGRGEEHTESNYSKPGPG